MRSLPTLQRAAVPVVAAVCLAALRCYAGVTGATEGDAGGASGFAEAGDADDGFAGEALGVESAFAGDAQVGASQAIL